jgi:hypothetical protein
MREFVMDVPAFLTIRIRAESLEAARKELESWDVSGVDLVADDTELDEKGVVRVGGCVTLYTKEHEHEEYRFDAPHITDKGAVCVDCLMKIDDNTPSGKCEICRANP